MAPRGFLDLDFDTVEQLDIGEILRVIGHLGHRATVVKERRILKEKVVLYRIQIGRKGVGGVTIGIDVGLVRELPPHSRIIYRSAYGIPAFEALVARPEFILREKAEAFVRRSMRDLFDIYFLLGHILRGKCLPLKTQILNALRLVMKRDWVRGIEALLLRVSVPRLEEVYSLISSVREC